MYDGDSHFPLPLPEKKKQPVASPPMDLDPQLYRLLNSAHHLLNATNTTLAEDCWLCLSPSLPQVLATPMDSLEASPGNKLNPPLIRPNITNIKLIHPAPQCLQVYRGQFHWGKSPRAFASISHSQQMTLSVCFLLELILFMELPPILAYLPAGRESVLKLS
jgi:hypothetical protein